MNVENRLLSLCVNPDKNSNFKISAICADSRKAIPGAVFVALKGKKQDGHDYLMSAIEKGAKALVVEDKEKIKALSFKGMICVVPNTRSILPVLLNEFYDYPSEKMFCIGITGTNGKTTVSSMLSFILSRCGWRSGLIGTIKNSFGSQEEKSRLTTPDPVELYKLLNRFYLEGAQALVMEVSSIGLDQQRVAELDFNLGVFTNLSEDHLDYHLNMSEYFQAKKKLFEMPLSLATGKNHFLAVVNLDDPYGIRLSREMKVPYISYGKKEARFIYEILSSNLSGTWFNLHFDKKKIKIHLPIPGTYNVSNAAAALCCAQAAGFSLKEAAEALAHFPGVPGRMEKVSPPGHTPMVFVDYAHTPQALSASLSFLKQNKSSRLITVFGCGGQRDRKKRPLMAQIAEYLSDSVILTSDNPREEDPLTIVNDCMKGVKDKEKFIIELDRKKAIKKALEKAKKTDLVFIAGKGHEQEQIIGSKRYPFSDNETVKEFFS
ncbi:MAG: UDP-N-acetylmuramoyl-L-alanyl-D-glutamate--2,6-diaminopimelate ligase [Bdellovibrionales bacterium]|nr:UDP-N-acetylmuramoyl-L-alanyl-D-glutamate--2,6-diaminopimelate ligase [Bdellovibrionales bacterium]